jgi:hypothetical protein
MSTRLLPIFTVLSFVAILHAESPIRPGDRIAIVGNTFADQLRIHGYLETILIQNSDVSIRNLGWGGDMLTARDRPTGFPTEEKTLSDHQTDVVIACFGFGESFSGEVGIENFKQDLEGFIASHRGKKYNGKSEVRIVLVSPIAYENLGEVTPAREKRNKELQTYSRAIRSVAKTANIPFVDLFESSRYLMEESGPNMTTNGVHLNAFGYWAISDSFCEQLIPNATSPWRITLDAKAASGEATGVNLSNIAIKDGGLHLQVTEKTPPSIPPPTTEELPPQMAARRDSLVVKNLAPDTYTLTIDEVDVVTGSNSDWEKGIAIDSSPAHRAAEAFRDAVNDKNLQFVYSWKALNQVHIVGERRKSPSGRALPAEVIEFNQIAKQRDNSLRKGIDLNTRQWKLAPSKR